MLLRLPSSLAVAAVAFVLAVAPPAFARATLTGSVVDAQNHAVVGAVVEVLTAGQASAGRAETDQAGRFAFDGLPEGSYLVVVRKTAFAGVRVPVEIRGGTTNPLTITLDVAGVQDEVTVTARRGEIELAGRSGQPVNVIDADEIADRAKVVVAQAVEQEAGVALQRTSPARRRQHVPRSHRRRQPRQHRGAARTVERSVRQRRAGRQHPVPHEDALVLEQRRQDGRVARGERRHRAQKRRRQRRRLGDAQIVNGAPLWPDDSLSVNGVGFRAAVTVVPSEGWQLSALVSRGFRAPHMTDLGTLGLTGSGFEVAAADLRASNLAGTVGTTDHGTAVSTGDAVEDIGPETSLNVEGTVAYRRRGFRSDVTVFVNNVGDNIQKVALILPAGAVGRTLGGTPITAQNANGAVFVAATTVPVLVRDNFDNAKIWGVEHALTASLGRGLRAQTAFTYIHAEDTATGLAPNIEGGTPQPAFTASLRWTSPDGRFFVEPYAITAWAQSRLSSLDLSDRRIGSGRTTASIRDFFNNGARNRGWIGNGADGVAGTPTTSSRSRGRRSRR